MGCENADMSIRILCPNLVISKNEPGLQWLIGSPFLPTGTIASTLRCIHSSDYSQESDNLRTLLPKGFEVIGALIVGNETNYEQVAGEAIAVSIKLRKLLSDSSDKAYVEKLDLVGAAADLGTGNARFFVSRNLVGLELVNDVIYENQPGRYMWERGCVLRCQLPIKLPVYYHAGDLKEAKDQYSRATDAIVAKLKDEQVIYIVQAVSQVSTGVPCPVIVLGEELNFNANLWNTSRSSDNPPNSDAKSLSCTIFCSENKDVSPFYSVEENAEKIQVSVLLNTTGKYTKSSAPIAEYFPALKETKLLVVDHDIEVICYASKDLSLKDAISKLVIPGLVDQLFAMKNIISPNLLGQHPLLHTYHFSPPGFVHPITAIYELNYGETEMKQVEVRRSLHLRLGLPFDRPLLRIANAINLSALKDRNRINLKSKGSSLLKDVHLGILSHSGVSGGVASTVQGSYDYHHYLQDGIDDSGWGCAYRSLQTIVSWFRLQHYTSIDIPSHREIQQCLVEIGDKDTSFIGSRDWIGAIELSFVLDKLLGVSCKVMNVRSGAELPEKCRELALHFENQGTPIMIGGGVLAYTLLGVDYNEASGDCAFLILDPHYTGSDDIKKIVNGGWIGWKKAVDSKGKHFFLHDKFYNLLLPQRPDMV